MTTKDSTQIQANPVDRTHDTQAKNEIYVVAIGIISAISILALGFTIGYCLNPWYRRRWHPKCCSLSWTCICCHESAIVIDNKVQNDLENQLLADFLLPQLIPLMATFFQHSIIDSTEKTLQKLMRVPLEDGKVAIMDHGLAQLLEETKIMPFRKSKISSFDYKPKTPELMQTEQFLKDRIEQYILKANRPDETWARICTLWLLRSKLLKIIPEIPSVRCSPSEFTSLVPLPEEQKPEENKVFTEADISFEDFGELECEKPYPFKTTEVYPELGPGRIQFGSISDLTPLEMSSTTSSMDTLTGEEKEEQGDSENTLSDSITQGCYYIK